MKKLLLAAFLCSAFFVRSQTTDSKGRKQGYWKKKDEKTNKLIYEGEFKDDKPVGKFRYYYPNDTVRAIMSFRPDGKTAYARLFHMNGKRMAEGKYVNREIKDSTWTYYDEWGILLSRERYMMGKKEGASYVYLPDGGLSEEKNFKNDVLHGPFKQYFDGVHLRVTGTYSNGVYEGRVSHLYPNGVEAAAGFYKKGQRNGPWIYRSQDGKITEKELYKNGDLAGKKETEEFFSKNKTEDKKPGTAPAVGQSKTGKGAGKP
jgi:antitoxin component YwqK of YwqJK toxin-antitoxin module